MVVLVFSMISMFYMISMVCSMRPGIAVLPHWYVCGSRGLYSWLAGSLSLEREHLRACDGRPA